MRNQLLNAIDNANGYQPTYDNRQYYDYNDIDGEQEKRSLAALARSGSLQQPNGKRNVASMARLGLMHPTMADNIKRSLATLAKNGQLPSREPDADDLSESQWSEYKRNIGSLARSGNIAAGKRNIAALARDYVLPTNGKRNLPSILRSGGGSNGSQQQTPKRNVAALARDNLYPIYQNRNAKRDVSAATHNTRTPSTPTLTVTFFVYFHLIFVSIFDEKLFYSRNFPMQSLQRAKNEMLAH